MLSFSFHFTIILFFNILVTPRMVYTEDSCIKSSDMEGFNNDCGVCKRTCPPTKYRAIDGSCNNLKNTEWGSAATPYGRLLPNTYSDGIYEFPCLSSGEDLPNARALRMDVYPSTEKQNDEHTLTTWGQIVAHDLSLTMGVPQTLKKPIPCCQYGKIIDLGETNPRCKPIVRPANDPAMFEKGNMCIDFVRTLTTMDQNCTSAKEPAKPLSAQTAYLDLSIVYGNSDGEAFQLRAFKDGRLKTLIRNGLQFPPQDPDAREACTLTSDDEPCYYTGDKRVNQNLQLGVLQVILLREHNRLADRLKSINPHWNDETLFQEARRILIAVTQHITYYEYLPRHLGSENMIKEKIIYLNENNHINDYDDSVDPSVYAEFASGAFRFFHTGINGQLKKYTDDRKEFGSIRFSDGHFKPAILEKDDNFNGLAIGLCTQTSNDFDAFMAREITEFFFRTNSTYGEDVQAIDIQRARDFGLANYNHTRVFCGLTPVKTFDDFKVNMSSENVEKLKTYYKNVKDVELLVAGTLEYLVPGTTVGPTFLCIILKQFYNSRVGDRFFYENGEDKEISFTLAQLQSIRKVTLSRIMCDNDAGFTKVQRRAFQVISEENPLVPCEEIPSLDLNLWKEEQEQ